MASCSLFSWTALRIPLEYLGNAFRDVTMAELNPTENAGSTTFNGFQVLSFFIWVGFGGGTHSVTAYEYRIFCVYGP